MKGTETALKDELSEMRKAFAVANQVPYPLDNKKSWASIRPVMVWKCLCIGHGSPTIIALWPYNDP